VNVVMGGLPSAAQQGFGAKAVAKDDGIAPHVS
jgi:hypothetical protein